MKKKKKTKIRRGRNKQTNKQKTATITVYYIIIITILLMITIWLLWLLLLLLLIWCQHSFTLTIIISSWVSIFLFFPPTRSEGRADHMCSDANASVDNNNWNRNVTIAIDCRTATVICLIVWFCFYFFFLSFFLPSFLLPSFLFFLFFLLIFVSVSPALVESCQSVLISQSFLDIWSVDHKAIWREKEEREAKTKQQQQKQNEKYYCKFVWLCTKNNNSSN